MTDSDISGLSLEQKAGLGSGANFWETKAAGEVPSIMMTDGPHGVRKQADAGDHLGIAESVPATCFPPAVGLGQTWDPELIGHVAEALGDECQAENVAVLLGPGINIKRSPLGGRNFEYFSEDPLLSGVFGAAWINGIQSRGVGASLKHFALNNQEDDRMRVSADVDERTLHEVYLRGFERAVKDARPWTVMCSYNAVNGVLVSENHHLLTEVLRDRWGYEGVVVSDWGAVKDRVAALAAGLDLQMPGGSTGPDAEVVDAVHTGSLAESAVDRAAARVAALAVKGHASHNESASYDKDDHHAFAREVAGRAIALLKNDGGLLPLQAGGSLAVIGEFAQSPRFQGGGSSHVNCTRIDVPLEELTKSAGDAEVRFAVGFTIDGSGPDQGLVDEAVEVARDADVAVVFLGLAADQESEGFDREHIELPDEQLELLGAVAAVQPRTVVVLSHGGAVRLAPVADAAAAILDGGLLGQAAGGGIADVLFGRVNPSAKLTETIPARLQDTPAYDSFPGERRHSVYGEGLFVGYRWYDNRDIEVTYPFGHGLSYTTFQYDDVRAQATDAGIEATVTVTNTGSRAGREIVQAYVSVPESRMLRVPRALAGFASVDLAAGESAEVTVRIERRDLAYWDIDLDRFVVEGGTYVVTVGASSRDLRGSAEVEVAGDDVRIPVTIDSTLAEVLEHPVAGPLVIEAFPIPLDTDATDSLGGDLKKMLGSIPLNRLVTFGPGVTQEQVDRIVEAANS
jgi:beta-glucosidase